MLPEAPRTASGYRLYDAGDVARLEFVGQAQVLGLNLEEVTEILQIVDEGREPCVHVRERLAARLEETRDRIRRLLELEWRLETTLTREWAVGSESVPACRCRIIECAGAEGAADGGEVPEERLIAVVERAGYEGDLEGEGR